jgi:hypothetical protein
MNSKLIGLGIGVGIGFVVAWAGLSDPAVIRDMLLLRDPHVFLLMGSAIVIAAIGVRLLRARGAKTWAGGEPVAWTIEKPEVRHVVGSVIFGAGWSLAATCPGPVAVMIGQGQLNGLVVAAGLIAGVSLQGAWKRTRSSRKLAPVELPGVAGL